MFVKYFQLILLLTTFAISHQYSFDIDESQSDQQKINDVPQASVNSKDLLINFLHSYFKPKQESVNGYIQLTPYEMNLLQLFINMLLQKGIGQEEKKHKKTQWHLRQGR